LDFVSSSAFHVRLLASRYIPLFVIIPFGFLCFASCLNSLEEFIHKIPSIMTSTTTTAEPAVENNNQKDPETKTDDNKSATEEVEEEEPRGMFAKLFRRKKQPPQQESPKIVNGAADLLDDESTAAKDDSSILEESSAESSALEGEEEEDDDDEVAEDSSVSSGDNDDSEDSKTAEIEEEEEEEEEEFRDDKSSQQQQQKEDELDNFITDDDGDDNFGDFKGDRNTDGEDDEQGQGEMLSLIKSDSQRNITVDATTTTQNTRKRRSENKNGLGASLTKLFGIKPKEEEQKERQGLLDSNTDDDDDGDDGADNGEDRDDEYHDKKETQKRRGLLENQDHMGSSRYHDSKEEEEDEKVDNYLDEFCDEPVAGEYRLESFYPSDSCRQESPEDSDLCGRIQGFGNDRGFAHHVAMSNDNNMLSMDIFESSEEKRGLLNGVGKAVSNLTQLILNRKNNNSSDEEDKRRMISYIGELEWKVGQMEKGIQSWKERSEQLQLEVYRLQGNLLTQGEDEDEWEESEEQEESSAEEASAANEKPLMDTEYANTFTEVVYEGTLIDITPQKPGFDPLAESSSQKGEDSDDDLMNTKMYQSCDTAASTFSRSSNKQQLKM